MHNSPYSSELGRQTSGVCSRKRELGTGEWELGPGRGVLERMGRLLIELEAEGLDGDSWRGGGFPDEERLGLVMEDGREESVLLNVPKMAARSADEGVTGEPGTEKACRFEASSGSKSPARSSATILSAILAKAVTLQSL